MIYYIKVIIDQTIEKIYIRELRKIIIKNVNFTKKRERV